MCSTSPHLTGCAPGTGFLVTADPVAHGAGFECRPHPTTETLGTLILVTLPSLVLSPHRLQACTGLLVTADPLAPGADFECSPYPTPTFIMIVSPYTLPHCLPPPPIRTLHHLDDGITGCAPGTGVLVTADPVAPGAGFECRPCPNGTYSAGGSIAPCTRCPASAFMVTPPGATRVSQCACQAGESLHD
jgi:hypothetical protein